MSASLNRLQLIGNVGRKPEFRPFPDGNRQATLSVATTDFWRDKESGERRERTEWHRVVTSVPHLVDRIERFVDVGTQVYIEAELRTRKYRENGADKDTYLLEIRCFELQLLGRAPTPAEPANDLPSGDDGLKEEGASTPASNTNRKSRKGTTAPQ